MIKEIKKFYGRLAVKNSDISIISNNCIGADIYHQLGMQFNSPTVNLQILPADFSRFVSNLEHYLSMPITECTSFTDEQEKQIYRTYRRYSKDLDFPFGLCDDVLLCFQHYKSFDDAKKSWNRRKERVNLDNLGIIMIADKEFATEFTQFDQIPIKKKLAFSINFDLNLPNTKVIRVSTPPGVHFMEKETLFNKYYEKNFNPVKWINS